MRLPSGRSGCGTAPVASGNKYLVLGILDHDYWKEGTKTPHAAQDPFDDLRDFKQGSGIHRNDIMLIQRVYYPGDEGGIMCDITPSENSKAALVCSLTHLKVVGEDALAGEMRSYPQERSEKVSHQGR